MNNTPGTTPAQQALDLTFDQIRERIAAALADAMPGEEIAELEADDRAERRELGI